MTKNNRKSILLVEDDELFRESIQDYLGGDYNVIQADSAENALDQINRALPEIILLDLTLPGMDGLEMLKRLSNMYPDIPVIMMTAIDRVPKVVECMRLGAFDYMTKPLIPEELQACLQRALESSEMKQELERRRNLQLLTNKSYPIIGCSASLEHIQKMIQTAAKADFPVLIQGPTGTGKEVVARNIHAASARASGPFVAVNCSAIPKDLTESEFFGHKKGAFTGAQTTEIGKFRLAHQGTLLLDEIGDLSADSQAKLLRALEEREFYPVGSTELIRVDARILASTNKNLPEMVKRNQFREDLFFRLNIFTISIPALCEHPQDIMPLCEFYMERFSAKFGKRFTGFTPAARESLLGYGWPGNVRELRNLIERIVLSEEGPTIARECLYFINTPPPGMVSVQIPESGIDLEEVEKQLILQALEKANGNKARAAKLLRLSAPTLYYRLEKYGLE